MGIVVDRVERAKFTVDRVHFRTRPTLLPGYYAIVGTGGGPMKLKGYRYIGPVFPYEHCWEECPEIVEGLDDTFQVPCPTVFWKDGTWRLIVGYAATGMKAYSWAWNKWVEDNSLLQGLTCPQDPDHPEHNMEWWWPGPRVFWMEGVLYILVSCGWLWYNPEDGLHYGPCRFLGLKWQENQWVECWEITEGLPVHGTIDTRCGPEWGADVFDLMWWDGVLRLICCRREYCCTDMYYWNVDQKKWVRDYEHENGLWDHGGGSHGVDIGFGLFELEGGVYVLDSSFLSDAKEWVDDHWESSDMWNGIDQDEDMPWPTIFRVR